MIVISFFQGSDSAEWKTRSSWGILLEFIQYEPLRIFFCKSSINIKHLSSILVLSYSWIAKVILANDNMKLDWNTVSKWRPNWQIIAHIIAAISVIKTLHLFLIMCYCCGDAPVIYWKQLFQCCCSELIICNYWKCHKYVWGSRMVRLIMNCSVFFVMVSHSLPKHWVYFKPTYTSLFELTAKKFLSLTAYIALTFGGVVCFLYIWNI